MPEQMPNLAALMAAAYKPHFSVCVELVKSDVSQDPSDQPIPPNRHAQIRSFGSGYPKVIATLAEVAPAGKHFTGNLLCVGANHIGPLAEALNAMLYCGSGGPLALKARDEATAALAALEKDCQ